MDLLEILRELTNSLAIVADLQQDRNLPKTDQLVFGSLKEIRVGKCERKENHIVEGCKELLAGSIVAALLAVIVWYTAHYLITGIAAAAHFITN